MTSYEYRASTKSCPTCRTRLDALIEIEPLMGGQTDESVKEYACDECPATYTLSESAESRFNHPPRMGT